MASNLKTFSDKILETNLMIIQINTLNTAESKTVEGQMQVSENTEFHDVWCVTRNCNWSGGHTIISSNLYL